MGNKHVFRICSYNCRSLKNSLYDIRRLCETHDFVCLQEHWLLPSELGLLANTHCDFYGFGHSAVDVTSNVLIGRPYGGTAVLYRKSLCNIVTTLPFSCSCITGLKLSTDCGPLLLLTVYMPTEYNDSDSLEKYIEVCANLSAIVTDSDIPHVVIVGDFNCQPGTRFFKVLAHFMEDNNLVMTDLSVLGATNAVFTYCSDSGSNTSWIDHVICSYTMNNNVREMSVLYDFICSDHRPLSLALNCSAIAPYVSGRDDKPSQIATPDWDCVDEITASLYSENMYHRLRKITIPDSLRLCCCTKCDNILHARAIDEYYRNVINCIKCSTERIIPIKTVCNKQFNVPGWNDFVQDKYDLSREAFLEWVSCSRPRSGVVFTRMTRARASFKLALRYCRQHETQMRADACAKALDLKDAKRFWNNVKKVNCDKATMYANYVNGASGDENIAYMWMEHFKSVYNSVDDDGSKDKFYARVNSRNCVSLCSNISVQEISDAIFKQKRAKLLVLMVLLWKLLFMAIQCCLFI